MTDSEASLLMQILLELRTTNSLLGQIAQQQQTLISAMADDGDDIPAVTYMDGSPVR